MGHITVVFLARTTSGIVLKNGDPNGRTPSAGTSRSMRPVRIDEGIKGWGACMDLSSGVG